MGIAVATLRIRENDPDIEGHLRRGFLSLFEIYGAGKFYVTVTANAVLRGHLDGRFSVFMGQDFGNRPRDYGMTDVRVVSGLADVTDLQTDFGVEDFAEAFLGNHADTSVSVHSLVSVVYLITRILDNDVGMIGRPQRTLY